MFKKFNSGGNPFMRNGFSPNSQADNFGQDSSISVAGEGTMTVQGAINKSFIMFGLLMLTAIWSFQSPNPVLIIGGAIVGLILVLISVFKKQYSNVLAPAYALVEGVVVGGVTAIYAGSFGGGIVLQAVSLTMLVLVIMLVIQKTGLIPVTQKFRMGVVMATGAIALLYIITMVLGFFGISIPYIHQGGTIGILFSIGVIGIAALNLLLDFDNIVKGEEYRAPKYMEWFSAMGLMITLIWLYFEMLRLLAKLRE
jgi:uncharacterized YccA/Bax inhibitor family protein